MFSTPFDNLFFCSRNQAGGLSGYTKISLTHKDYPQNESYITFNQDGNLYINWQDWSEAEKFDITTLKLIFDFLDKHLDKPLVLYCDFAQSRSPAIVMAYLSSKGVFSSNFYEALEQMQTIQPEFVFPSGITTFLKTNWREIVKEIGVAKDKDIG